MSYFESSENAANNIERIKRSREDQFLWTEKYRPVGLESFIGNEDVKSKLARAIESNDIGHLLFYGSPGTGKTSIAKVLTSNIKCDNVYVNASDQNSVDDIRTTIKGFASTVGFNDLKLIVLDECLDENTLVWAYRNNTEILLPIKDLQYYDMVKSYKVSCKRYDYNRFDLIDMGMSDVYEITFEDDVTVICTDTHKWYVEETNDSTILIKTKQLISGEYNYIVTTLEPNRKDAYVRRFKYYVKSIRKLDEQRHVYDLNVTYDHNFLIGTTGILTHNCDYLSMNAMAALRNLMETFSQHTRFILTCNNVEKIHPAIISRCQSFEIFPPSKKEIAKHVSNILQKENVTFDNVDLAFVVNSYYPDIRRIINVLQSGSIDGKLMLDKKSVIESDYKLKVLECLKSFNKKEAFEKIRQILADNKASSFTDIYTKMYQNVDDFGKGHIAESILVISEGQVNDSFSYDKEINFMATIIKLLNTIK